MSHLNRCCGGTPDGMPCGQGRAEPDVRPVMQDAGSDMSHFRGGKTLDRNGLPQRDSEVQADSRSRRQLLRPASPFIINAGPRLRKDRADQAAAFSSSSLNSSSRETFFSVTLASSRMKSTTLSS